jgi:hypothetical protein
MKNLTPILLTATVLGLATTLFSTESLAQVSADPDAGYTNNERDPMMGEGGLNPLQMIHNARFRNNRSMQEFYQDQNRNLDAARNNLFRQRQQLLQNYQPETAETSPAETEAQGESEVPVE